MKRLLFLFICLLFSVYLLPTVSIAAPSISGTSGTISDGSSVVISGSSFGSKSTAAPQKYDFFEQSGGDYDAGDPIANSWGSRASDSASYHRPRYSTTSPRTGSTKHIRCDFTVGSVYSTEFWYDTGGTLNEAYVTGWVKTTDQGTNHIKFLRIVQNPIALGTMYPDWLCLWVHEGNFDNARGTGPTSISGDNYWSTGGWPDTTWLRIELWIKRSTHESSPYDADGYIWVNVQDGFPSTFTAVQDKATKSNNDEAAETYRYVDFCEYGMRSAGDALFEWDDIYIDNTRARVEIGNDPTFASCTHREIQIPTAWAAGEITITVNAGSISDLLDGSHYLFVVDADGVPNTVGELLEAGIPGATGGCSFYNGAGFK